MRLTDIVGDTFYVRPHPLDFFFSCMFPRVYVAKEIEFQRVGWSRNIRHVFDWTDPDFPMIGSGWMCDQCGTVFYGSYTDDLKHECTDPK